MAQEKKQPGSYFGILVEAGLDTLNNEAKTPFIYLTFEVTHQAVDGEWSAFPDDGKFRRDIKFWLTDKAWERTQRDLTLLGFDGNFDDPKFKPELYTEGSELICSHETGQDTKIREEWGLPGIGTGPKERKPPEKKIVRDLSAKWKNTAAVNKKPAGGPQKPPAAPSNPPAANDDIPF